MHLDLLLQGGTIISDSGRFEGSIGIANGKVVGEFAPGSEPAASEIVDCRGKLILPGLIDMHCHHREGSEKALNTRKPSKPRRALRQPVV